MKVDDELVEQLAGEGSIGVRVMVRVREVA